MTGTTALAPLKPAFSGFARIRSLGMYSVRDEDDLASFQTEDAISGARAFARQLLKGEAQ